MKITRAELNQKYNLNINVWNRKHDVVMAHLSLYMDIIEIKERGQYFYEIKGDMPDNIPPVPRKTNREEKEKDYEEYVIHALGTEFSYNSQAKIAREAIRDFAKQKYQHGNYKRVAQSYVSKPFKRWAEKEEDSDAWVWYQTYTPLDSLALDRWIQIMREEHITEKEQAQAFRRYANGEDIKEEVSYYKRAMDRFVEEFGDFAIKVPKYKCRGECGE